ncbi:hypothetical protein B0H12DRAFT_1147998 [Mycena haematopus]|nr:hypothetical protein B0H12DRAFT_1147998 [Mycena haematopus]
MGFLYLCPEEDFRTGPSSFRWPECAAYWSLDPSGADRLSPEDSTRLGFPPIRLTTQVGGRSLDASVYDGLRQFHKAKGFDPETQDLARHLGHPLYQLSSDEDYATDNEYPRTSVHGGTCSAVRENCWMGLIEDNRHR